MIVDESAILSAALSQRLQVGRVLAVDPARGLRDTAEPPVLPPTVRSPTPQQIATTLPLGSIVVAHVTADLAGQVLTAQIDDLPIALDWPTNNGPAPRAGESVALRVVTHQPTLTLQVLPPQDDVAPPQLSVDPSRLHVVRFDEAWMSPAATATSAATVAAATTATPATVGEPVTVPVPPRSETEPMTFVPLLLQGPAWAGQPMELVVHRDRADDDFDNAALDCWCGEVVIDLPHLGRVAGHLAFSMQGLRVRLEGDDEASVAAMTEAAADLATAFGAAGLRIAAVSVGNTAVDGRADRG